MVNVPLNKLSAEDRKFLDRQEDAAVPTAELPGVEGALRKPATVDARNQPLQEVVFQLAAPHKINVWFDFRTLADVGVPADTPITYQAKDQPLEDVLHNMLGPLQLDAYPVKNEVLVIASNYHLNVGRKHILGLYMETRVYVMKKKPAQWEDLKELRNQIMSQVSPGEWDRLGGAGTSYSHYTLSVLVVRNTYWVLREIEERFGQQLQRTHVGPLSFPTGLRVPDALLKPCTMEVHAMKLSEFATYLNNSFGLKCELDGQAMKDVGIPDDLPVSAVFRQVRLMTALDLVLGNCDLMYVIKEDGTLTITTPSAALSQLVSVDYPVGPLTNSGSGLPPDYTSLHQLIRNNVATDSWTDVGGAGSITLPTARQRQGTITIRQSLRIHVAVAEFLDQLRAAGR